MLVFGVKPKIESDETLRWALVVAFMFLVNIINLKLLISMIGETFTRQQISRVALCYQMKATYLLELAKFNKQWASQTRSSVNKCLENPTE